MGQMQLPKMEALESLAQKLVRRWRVFWLWHAGYGFWGRMGSRMAGLGLTNYRQLHALAWMTPRGFISPYADVYGPDVRLGEFVFIGDRAVIGVAEGNGFVELRDRVIINQDVTLEAGVGGSIRIGPEVGIERGCVMFASLQPIEIRRHAEIAAYCSFFSYDHGVDPDREIFGQPCVSKGPILIDEDAWLGVGVRVQSGVTIGKGAVVGAGSVVTRDIPPGAIAVGAPARVIKHRNDLRSRKPRD